MPEHPFENGADTLAWTPTRLWPQFQAHCVADPQAIALVDCDDRTWSRADLSGMAVTIAAELRRLGVGRRNRVLVAGYKTAATLATALAISFLEGIFCPYSSKLGPAEIAGLEGALGHAAKVVCTSDRWTITTCDKESWSNDPRDIETVLIGFTSGSTGVPKGVMHGAEALNYASQACAAIAGLDPDDAVLGIVPLDSAPGFTFTAHFALSQGRRLVFVDPWDPVEAMTRAERFGCGWAVAVPTHLFTMVEAARQGLWTSRLPMKAVAVGGSAMTPDLIADADALLGVKALRMFGMSECMGHCSTRPDHNPDRRQGYDGWPFPGTEEEAFDANLKVLPRGQRGEAGVRGPSLFLGYALGMGAGQEKMTPSGYYLTGDEIIRDEDGYVRVVGRIKDQIIRGGFNIDPAEVEAVLRKHPAISEVAVVAVPETKLGEQACAVCQLRPGFATVDLNQIVEHMQASGVSRKKWPEHVVVVEAMIIGQTGKLDKKAMAACAADEIQRRRLAAA